MSESTKHLSDIAVEDERVTAAIYARTSSIVQRFGYSLDEQVRLCLERCQLLGWDTQYVFRDEAESGKNIDRPMFQTMMTTAEQGLFDVIVFWKLDRFSRSLLHAVQLESELRGFGVGLHSITEQIDTTTSSGRFNFRNLASAAEFERDMIKERTRMGLKALAVDGRWPNSQPPLGYELSIDGRLRISAEEARLVNQIFERYVEVKSMPEVAHELNRQAVSTKRGNEWTSRAVRDVLRNALYIGCYVVSEISKDIPEYQIVSKELFEKATTIRFRFRGQGSSRSRMALHRKQQSVDHVIDQYQSFINQDRPVEL
ncbi:Site-specific DNA recombinase [Halogranum rubrum]|uniref:Site-specific DNA recombinase n=1 Tax=Halogranum rubrum TaxID=553466 RepID=A0A1I4FUU5_9EURY|nr:recombinase family protein [Halogranum rubrum]SFL21614.1 Site-specific DNA recombinase [Halogranum rubrum]